MSIHRPLEITCNFCRARQTVTVWETVNVTMNPEMKDAVTELRVNVFACTCCGSRVSRPPRQGGPQVEDLARFVRASRAYEVDGGILRRNDQ